MASFLVPDIFMVEKCVHYDIWNNFFSLFAHFSNLDLAENLINEPNHMGGPNIKMYTYYFHYNNDGEKCLAPKIKPQ